MKKDPIKQKRPRAIAGTAEEDQPAPVASRRSTGTGAAAGLLAEARAYLLKNEEANKVKREAEKAKERLLSLMKAEGTKLLQVPEFGKEVELLFAVSNEVDVRKLATLVTKEKFMQIVSATQTAVTEKAGTAVLTECLVSRTATEPSLKVRKI